VTAAGVAPRIAVVIVNYRTPGLALGAVRSLIAERARLPTLRAVVVDGGSGDGSADRIAAGLADPSLAGWATLTALPLNGGFGWANNQAIQALMQGDDPPDYIHLLNPDAEVEPGAVVALAAVLDREPGCAAVGSLLLDPDGTPSGSAFRFQGPVAEFVNGARAAAVGRLLRVPPVLAAATAGQVDWATGASLMLRTAALRETGLFDTGFFLYFEEVELMWRLGRAGWTVRHEPASRVRHVGGAATGVRDGEAQSRRLKARPSYWYRSRRRQYALTRGRRTAAAAGLAWLAGNALFGLRRLAGLGGRQHLVIEREGRDLWRHGLWPDASDTAPAATPWDEPPGRPPAWMAARPR